jgi:hypothetical protein
VDRLQLRGALGDELFALANDLPSAVVELGWAVAFGVP